jgi:hypothetical protein
VGSLSRSTGCGRCGKVEGMWEIVYMATRSPEHLLTKCCSQKMRILGFALKSIERTGGESNLLFCVTRYRVFIVPMYGSKGSCESKMENGKISKMSKNRKMFS